MGIYYFNSQLYWSYFVVAVPVALVLACYSLFYVDPELKIKVSIAFFSSYGTLLVLNTALSKMENNILCLLESNK